MLTDIHLEMLVEEGFEDLEFWTVASWMIRISLWGSFATPDGLHQVRE